MSRCPNFGDLSGIQLLQFRNPTISNIKTIINIFYSSMHFPELKFLSSNFLLEQDVLWIDSLFHCLLSYKCDILWIRILHNKTDQLDQPDHTQYQCIPEHSHVSQWIIHAYPSSSRCTREKYGHCLWNKYFYCFWYV